MEAHPEGGSALFAQLGHKGDLLIPHFRKNFEGLNEAELKIASLALSDYLEPAGSYVSIVELGLYDSTVKLYESLREAGVRPHDENGTPASKSAWPNRPRPWPRALPARSCAPLSLLLPDGQKARRGQELYAVPIERRRDMMREHGMIGRGYAGRVKQIISGSIGFDDWGMGGRSLRRRSQGVQATHLRDAFRRGQRRLCRFRAVLHRAPFRRPASWASACRRTARVRPPAAMTVRPRTARPL